MDSVFSKLKIPAQWSRTVGRARHIVRALPFDASCLARDELAAARIRRFVNQRRWRRVPRWSVPILLPLARLAWLLRCPIATTYVARRRGVPAFGPDWRRAVVNGWLYSRAPHLELLKAPFGDAPVMRVGQLDDRHWLLLWGVLGSPSDQDLARDKLALSERIESLGVRVPQMLCEITRGAPVDAAALPWAEAPILFIKPRHGSRAIGASSVQRLNHPLYRVNGEEVVHGDVLSARLTKLALDDALLVQVFQRPAVEALDLSSQTPIELRLTTVRMPGGEPFVMACMMKVQPPGSHASTVLTGALSVPVDPRTGTMHAGFFLLQPERQYPVVPWNGAVVEGRQVPQYECAANMVITASRALPGLPVMGWDVLITDAGPVILETNTNASWWFTHVWHALTGTPSSLLQIVIAWIDMRDAKRQPAGASIQ
jgi:hypothetical protein